MTILGYGTHAGHKYRHITEITTTLTSCVRRRALCGKVKPRHVYSYGQTHAKEWWITNETLEEALADLTTRPSYHKPCPRCVAIASATPQKEVHT